MLGWQASGAAPIVRGEPVLHPETLATAIQIGNPASWQGAVAARDESGGHIGEVTDGQIIEAYRMLAAEEGCFVEPASAASVAGLLQAAADGLLTADDVAVCTVTGHGLKDPNRAIAEVQVGRSGRRHRRDGRRRAGPRVTRRARHRRVGRDRPRLRGRARGARSRPRARRPRRRATRGARRRAHRRERRGGRRARRRPLDRRRCRRGVERASPTSTTRSTSS